MSDITVPLAAIGLVGSILALVVTPLFSLLRANTKALDKVAVASEKVAKEHKKGNQEAKERNGHLAELVIQTSENTVEALKSVKEQKVQEQTVAHQVIKEIK